MSANYRKLAQQYVGKPITVKHRNGTLYHGILHSVQNDGLQLRLFRGQHVSNPELQVVAENAIGSKETELDAENVFFPVWPVTFLITFALLAGLWGWGAYGAGAYGYGGAPGAYGYYRPGVGPRGRLWW